MAKKTSKTLKVGIVGAAGRGAIFKAGLEANEATVHAICDINKDALPEAAERMGAQETYTNYKKMIEQSGVDAVVIATPMHLHVPQSIMAIERGIHVLCEVPAGVSVEECRKLVKACRKSKAVYMMAENYTYIKEIVLIKELARQGLFGEVFYAEAEYLHELKELNEITTWRRKWQTGVPGITYGTHSLGPILQCMPGDRVARVCCETTGSHYKDPRGKAYAADSATMLGKMAKGGLVKIRVDMVSDRPHAAMNYQLQGTDGCYESGRGGPTDHAKLWLRKLATDKDVWMDIPSLLATDSFAKKYLPKHWYKPPAAARKAGHGGGDYFECCDWVRAIRGEAPCPIGIDETMDMTLPGLLSQESARKNGAWLPVPDSRKWK